MNRIELVLVLLFTFFVIVVWVTSDVILARPEKPEDPKIQTMLEPLNPTFDQETMQLINSRTLTTPIRPTPRPTTDPVPVIQPSASPTVPTPNIPVTDPEEAATEINDFTVSETETEDSIETPSPTPQIDNTNEQPSPIP